MFRGSPTESLPVVCYLLVVNNSNNILVYSLNPVLLFILCVLAIWPNRESSVLVGGHGGRQPDAGVYRDGTGD